MSQVVAETYRFTRSSRSTRALLFVMFWWLALAFLYFVLEAAPFIVASLALFSVPALIDIRSNATATFEITDSDIRWSSGKRSAYLPRAQLKTIRLDTRLDLSLRMTLLTHQGGKTRLPYECVPPAPEIEATLKACDIPYERHHFTLLS